MLDTRDSAKVMLGNSLYNKETVQHTLNVSNIIPRPTPRRNTTYALKCAAAATTTLK